MNAFDDAKRLIAVLDSEIALLRSVFSAYARLYRGDEEVRLLLSESDRAFFTDLHIVYLHYISISVSRLLDPANTGKKMNLSIAAVIDILRTQHHPSAIDLDTRLRRVREDAYNFIEPRNQLVSHLDLAANDIDSGKRSIPSFTEDEFESFYRDTGNLMNDIRQAIRMDQNMYDWGVVGHGCGRQLLHRLRTAHEQLKEEQEVDALLERCAPPCRKADEEGNNGLQLMTDIGTAARTRAIDHMRSSFLGARQLVICDPYFLLSNNRTSKADYLTGVDDVIPTTVKTIELYVKPRRRDAEVAAGFTKLCQERGIRLTCRRTDEIHDRVWIVDSTRAFVVGTSFNGLGSRCAFILELPEEDRRNFIRELGLLRERTTRSSSA